MLRRVDSEQEGSLEKFAQLRKEHILCDVEVIVSDGVSKAHGVIISIGSEYFRDRLTAIACRENKRIELKYKITKGTLENVLDFLYSGNIKITESNACALLEAAVYLRISSLKFHCEEFTISRLSLNNCFQIMDLSKKFKSGKLDRASMEYICKNFLHLSKNAEFLCLEPEYVEKILCCKFLTVKKEEDVFVALSSWVQHDISRKQTLPHFFKKLDFFAMSKFFIADHVANDQLIVSSPKCTAHLIRVISSMLLPGREDVDLFLADRVTHSCNVDCVILAGGTGRKSRSIMCYVPSRKAWRLLRDTRIDREGHVMAISENLSYIFGGRASESKNFLSNLNTLQLDPVLKTSQPIRGPEQDRYFAAAAILDGIIYIFGGKTSDRFYNVTETVVSYDPSTNTWHSEPSLTYPRYAHCAVALHGNIYVMGGQSGSGNILRSVEKYSPRTGEWTCAPSMTIARMFASAVVLKNQIFITGGKNGWENSEILSSTEIFDACTNVWTVLGAQLCVALFACGIARVGSRVYVFGGADGLGRGQGSVECYDAGRDEWTITDKMPSKRAFLQAGVISL
ncbi:predicted protein, partial [Nematostella vectensis]